MTDSKTNPAQPMSVSGQPRSAPVNGGRLQRGAGLALWRQIADRLRERIIDGGYAVGSKIPNEIDLAAEMAVHRHTVRRAIAELRKDGLLEARRGEGTYVAREQLPYPVAAETRFHEIVSGEGRVPHGELVDHTLLPAPVKVADALNLHKDADALRIQSVHRADGVPISTATSWFDPVRFPNLAEDFGALGSLTKALRRSGVERYARRGTTIAARMATDAECQRLDLSSEAIVLITAYVNYNQNGRPIQMSETSFAASRVRLLTGFAAEKDLPL